MKQATFEVKSSSGDPYTVEVMVEYGSVTIFCDCKAGEWNKVCKHKTAIMTGDPTLLVKRTEAREEKLRRVAELIQRTDYAEILADLEESEEAMKKAKNRKQTVKRHLEKRMSEGFPLRDA